MLLPSPFVFCNCSRAFAARRFLLSGPPSFADSKTLIFASCHRRVWHHRHEQMTAFETASCLPDRPTLGVSGMAGMGGKRTGCFRAALEIIAPLHPAALIPGDDFGIVLADLLSPISGVDNQDSNGGRDDNKLRVLKHALGWNIATPPKESPDHQSNGYPNSHIPWLRPGSIPHVLYDRKWAKAPCPQLPARPRVGRSIAISRSS